MSLYEFNRRMVKFDVPDVDVDILDYATDFYLTWKYWSSVNVNPHVKYIGLYNLMGGSYVTNKRVMPFT